VMILAKPVSWAKPKTRKAAVPCACLGRGPLRSGAVELWSRSGNGTVA
jgi:hypothetical protein